MKDPLLFRPFRVRLQNPGNRLVPAAQTECRIERRRLPDRR